jgi:WD40 repeat protein/serine/threonine protein kinase
MGVVYEAEQISLGRRVALKVLPLKVSSDPMILERFRREARAAARLHHTNIVPVFGVGQDGDVKFYAMQFIQGQGLDTVIAELRRLRERSESKAANGAAPGVLSPPSRTEHPGQGLEEPNADECLKLSPVVQSILTGRFDPPGICPDLADGSRSMLARALAVGLAPATGTESGVACIELAGTATAMAAEVGELASSRTQPPAPASSAPAATASSSATQSASRQLSSVEAGRRGFFRSLAQVGRQVASGLAYAHGRGIVHRDIKPSNLLLDTEGVAWITDFGLAKGDDEGLTQSGDILGTIRYMAPERFRGQGDARADVYALGLTLYELLTLRPGFDSTDRLRLIEQIKTEEPRKPRAIDGRIPRDLETIVLKAIEKDPKARYQSAEAMGQDLGRFLADEPIRARQVSAIERGWRWCRRNKAAAALLATSALAALALVGVLVGASYNSQLKHANLQLETTNSALAASRKDEQAQRERAERNLYYRNILLAGRELQENHVGRVEELLQQTPAGFRGWEWNYLLRQCRVPLATFTAPGPDVFGVALSRDGQLLAASTASGSVRVWDLATGLARPDFQIPGSVYGVAFHPSGMQLAAGQAAPGTDSQVVRVWSLPTGRILDLLGHTGEIYDVAFSRDGTQLASASSDGTVRVWDVSSGQCRHVLRGPCHSYVGVVFSPDGNRVFASGGTANLGSAPPPPYEITVWDVRTGTPLKRFPHDALLNALALSQAGTRLAVGDWHGRVWLRDLEHDPDGLNPRALRGHTACVNRVPFSLDDTRLASASDDGSIKIWDVVSGEELFTLRGHHAGVQGVAFHPNGNQVVSVSSDGTARFWNARIDPQARTLHGHTGPVRGLAYSPDGSRLASVSEDRTLRFWDLSTGNAMGKAVVLSEKGQALAYRPDGRQLAIACGDWSRKDARGMVEIRDSTSGQLQHRRQGHQRVAWAVAYHARGDWLVSAGGEVHLPGDIILWDPTTGDQLGRLPEISEGLYCLGIHPGGNLLATGSMSGTIRLWDLERGELVWSRQVHTGFVTSTSFSPSGTTLLCSGQGDPRVKLLNPRDGEELQSIRGPTHEVAAAIYSRDGRRLATASMDGRIQIWDAETGEELLSLRHFSFGIAHCLAFNPEGTELASAGTDGVIRLWDARSVLDLIPDRR